MSLILILGLAAVVAWLNSRLNSVEQEVRQLKDDALLEKLRASRREATDSRVSELVTQPVVETTAAIPKPPPVAAPPPIPDAVVAAVPMPPPPVKIVEMPRVPSSPARKFDWEQFLGVKLFAWICGLALFFAAVFFVKYSFERGLVPPWLRAVSGFGLGMVLVGAGWRMLKTRYAATGHTLTATGVVILYAVTFACRAFYHFDWAGVTQVFAVMACITAGAFALSVRMDSRVVAVLGMLGGFLTPPLLSTGEDNPGGLFGYIAILDLGLLAIVWRKRWNFLVPLAAIGTAFMELGWSHQFFVPEKLWIARLVFSAFAGLFTAFCHLRVRRGNQDGAIVASAVGLCLVAIGYVFSLIPAEKLQQAPVGVFSIALVADALALSLIARDRRLRVMEAIFGSLVFVQLAIWTFIAKQPPLTVALGLYLVFGLLHSVFPVVAQRLDPESKPTLWARLAPAISLLLTLIPLIGGQAASWAFWPVVLLCNGFAILLALALGSVLSVLAGFAVTLAVATAWIVRGTSDGADIAENMFVITGFAVFFFAVGLTAFRNRKFADQWSLALGRIGLPEDLRVQIPALAAAMPFLLVGLLASRARLTDPSALFGVSLFLAVLLIGLAVWSRARLLFSVALAGVLSVQTLWILFSPVGSMSVTSLAWHLGFLALFLFGPFLRLRKEADSRTLWASSALATLGHWPLVLKTIAYISPDFSKAAVTALFAPPLFLGMEMLRRGLPSDLPKRSHHLAWFAGTGLFFVTAALGQQFSRQWLSIAWTLEGVALVALYRPIRHVGLLRTGIALLLLIFARLALNQDVLDYERSGVRIWNWYLAAYGVGSLSFFAAAKLVGPFREKLGRWNVQATLYALGTILLFLLVNIEIADFFGSGTRLHFISGAGLAQNLAYTVAWALFALGLVAVGLVRKLSAPRWSGLALLGGTLLKLFFSDLSNLDQLYRIGAFASVAVIGIAVSLLYQRLIRTGEGAAESRDEPAQTS